MGILSHRVLNPIIHQVENPFFSIVEEIEDWLLQNQVEYFETIWPRLKRLYITRLLRLEKNGSAILGLAKTAPTDDLASAILDIYQLLDSSVYFASKYWRAFLYWLQSNKFSSCWPQFKDREAILAYSVLTEDEILTLKKKAEKEWLDFFSDASSVADLFAKMMNPIQALCYKRVRFLSQYDPALYSFEDVYQHVCEEILKRLRANDYISRDASKMVAWCLKCTDNILHNLREKAFMPKRGNLAEVSYFDTSSDLCDTQIHPVNIDWVSESSEVLSIESPYSYAFEDNLCVEQLLRHADPKINCYLRTICKGEHNTDFWTWFYYNEPYLSRREAYLAENPEAIGPYLQRHLNLSTYQLTNFLRQHLPSILDRISNTPQNKALLSYV